MIQTQLFSLLKVSYISFLIDFHYTYLEISSYPLFNDGFGFTQVFPIKFLDKLIFQPV